MGKQIMRSALAREAFGPVTWIPKNVFAAVAFEMAKQQLEDDAVTGDAAAIQASRRFLEVWERLAPSGLPLPTSVDKPLLAGAEANSPSKA